MSCALVLISWWIGWAKESGFAIHCFFCLNWTQRPAIDWRPFWLFLRSMVCLGLLCAALVVQMAACSCAVLGVLYLIVRVFA